MFNKAKLKFDDIFENRLSEDEVREYLIELYKKGETANEIAAAASAMREHMIPLNLPFELQDKLIDNCGTGGDKSNSFNISTTVSILLSACGSYVAKHGNRSITSKSGSADMLEALGIDLNLSFENQAIMMEKTGFIFMFAQNHHPAMKHIMPIRKSLDHRTIFNILGPLSNPAGVKKQLIGVFDKDYISKIVEALKIMGTKNAMVVSSKDGMDEISICDITYASILECDSVKEMIIDPREYGFNLAKKEDIIGGDAKDNAKITRGILEGTITDAKRDIVLLNTAAALLVDGKVSNIQEGIDMAKDVILTNKASQKLNEIIKISNELSS